MSDDESQNFGRYALYGEIAAGGMATVHYGRLLGQVGFSRPVAIKRLLPELADDPDFVKMFLEEARLAARVRHPNVIAALDVVSLDEEILLVMDYVHGETLSRLVRVAKRMGEHIPPRIAVGIMCGALEGLHAAHEAKSEKGQPLGLVHRDVSPQNIMIGKDGVTRVLDFGVAKATAKRTETRGDLIKGKAAYMAPEQLASGHVDQRADIFGASVCLWQALTGERLFTGDSFEAIAQSVVTSPIRLASELAPNITRSLDEVLMKGLDREADHRWSTAREMAIQLERALAPASIREIGTFVERIAGDKIEARARVVAQIERVSIASISVGDLAPDSRREEAKIPDLVKSAAVKDTHRNLGSPAVPFGEPFGGPFGGPQIPQVIQSSPNIHDPSPNSAPQSGPAQGMPQQQHAMPAHLAPAQMPMAQQVANADRTPIAVVSQPEKKKSTMVISVVAIALTIGIGAGLIVGMRALQQRAAAAAAATESATSPQGPSLFVSPSPIPTPSIQTSAKGAPSASSPPSAPPPSANVPRRR